MLSYEYIYKNKKIYNKNNDVNQNLTNYLLLYNVNNKPIDIYI